MKPAAQHSKNNIVFWLIGILFISLSAPLFPVEFMQSNEKADNPQGCFYYLTLQSILANSVLLSSDKANVTLIKSRLLKFEKDLQTVTLAPAVVASYRQQYLQILSLYGLTSINAVQNEKLLLSVARSTFKPVDNFYLDNRIFCINPLYNSNLSHTMQLSPPSSRSILRFNMAPIYDKIPNRYSRILAATPDQYQLGIFSGFFVNNQTTNLNIQLTTGIPLLTALYVLPGDDFVHMGTYNAIVPWNAFGADYFINPMNRKIMNITGIDVFSVEKKELAGRSIPDVIPVPTDISKVFLLGDNLLTYINSESYGMVYLANRITYRHPNDVKPYEKMIGKDFAHGGKRPELLVTAIRALYAQLDGLHAKHDIILESRHTHESQPANLTLAGLVDIKGIVGERAMFTTYCLRQDCTLVFNFAKAPGWHVYVNGKSRPLERANFAFMATTVPQGPSTVWFIYQSWIDLFSYLLSMVSLIGIFLLVGKSPQAATDAH